MKQYQTKETMSANVVFRSKLLRYLSRVISNRNSVAYKNSYMAQIVDMLKKVAGNQKNSNIPQAVWNGVTYVNTQVAMQNKHIHKIKKGNEVCFL